MCLFKFVFFGFDFTSKHYVSALAQVINTLEGNTLLKPAIDFNNYLEEALDLAVDTVINITRDRNRTCERDDNTVQDVKTLCTSVVQKLLVL